MVIKSNYAADEHVDAIGLSKVFLKYKFDCYGDLGYIYIPVV
jgi:hypothetical protein